MRKIDALLHAYGLSHQHASIKVIHRICLPLIILYILSLFWFIPFGLISAPVSSTTAEFANWASLLLLLMRFIIIKNRA